MKLENQVCTKIQGYRLQELGIDGTLAIFSHCVHCPDPTGQHEGYEMIMSVDHYLAAVSEQLAPAFTVAELGVMMPTRLSNTKEDDIIISFKSKSDDYFFTGAFGDRAYLRAYPTEAQARAAMLIRLLETNIITAEECNKRLAA